MSKLKIVSFGDPVLRQNAKPVTVFHGKLHTLINSMAKTLKSSSNGAAIAANQISVLKRIIVIDYDKEYFELINPEIIASEGEQTDYEGCLSLPGYFGLVKRYDYVKVKFQNRDGEEFIVERTDRLARCFQHEIDHLDGILFVDRMTEEFLVGDGNDSKIRRQDVIDIADGKILTESKR
jgi:peptide deformylase